MLVQSLKLRKQRKLAKDAAEDEKELNKNDTNSTANANKPAGALTAEERAAKKAEREAARAAKKEEMKMIRDLQAVQGTALLDEMKANGGKTAVAE
jgi:phage portal protein BeeE